MFAKLLKHEWRGSSRILTVLSLAALGAGAVGAVLLRVLMDNANMLSQEAETGWMPGVMSLLLAFAMLGLMAYAFGGELLLLHRFYKSKFTDEGYLTFTLPVSSRQIFLASFVNMIIWSVIILAVVVASFAMIVLISAAAEGFSLKELLESYPLEEYGGGYIALNIVSSIVSFISGIILPMTCVVVGAVLAKKHKLLTAFGIYYGVSMVKSILSSVIMSAYSVSAQMYEAEAAMNAMNWAELGIQTVLAVGGFFLSTWLMEKKLNLP